MTFDPNPSTILKGQTNFIMDEHPYSEYEFKLSRDKETGLIDITKTPVTMSEDTNKNGFWKYNEDKILKQLEQIGRAHV
mgnify:CR=1 FL=1